MGMLLQLTSLSIQMPYVSLGCEGTNYLSFDIFQSSVLHVISGTTPVLAFFNKLNFCYNFALLGCSSLRHLEKCGVYVFLGCDFVLIFNSNQQHLRQKSLSGYFPKPNGFLSAPAINDNQIERERKKKEYILKQFLGKQFKGFSKLDILLTIMCILKTALELLESCLFLHLQVKHFQSTKHIGKNKILI